MARLYLAGAEPIELLRTVLDNGGTSVLLSFYYLQQRGALPKIFAALKSRPDVRVFLDSGSVTFAKKDHGDPQPYWRAYYELLKEHGHRFEYASEFDIDGYAWKLKGATRRVDADQIEAWRDDLAELQTVPIVPVWRESRGMAAWDALLQDARFPHLAFGSDADISRGVLARLITQAHTWNKTVHGFGQGYVDDLRLLHFDTVSVSTWLMGQKYGDAFIFEGGHLQRIYQTSKKAKGELKRRKRYFERIGVDPAKILAGDRMELNKANALAWLALSKRLELAHAHKGPQRHTAAVGQPQTGVGKETSVLQPDERTAVPMPSKSPATTASAKSPVSTLVTSLSSQAEHAVIPLRPVESITVEKTEEREIELQQTKSFMPAGSPALLCASCAFAADCPKFSENAVCAYRDEFANIEVRDANQVVDQLASIFALNIERGRYLRLAEQLNGQGIISPDVTKHFTETFQMGAKLAELMKGKKGVKATAQGDGVISRLFGGLGAQPARQLIAADEEQHEIPADYEHEEIPDETEDVLTERQKKQRSRQASI